MDDSDREEETSEDGPFDFPDDDEGAAPATGWLGAIGQMIAALIVVFGVVALFMGTAVVLRRLWP